MPCQCGGELGLHAEVVFVEVRQDPTERRHPHHLVAALHVVDPEAGEHVRRQRQQSVGESVGPSNHVRLDLEPSVPDHRIGVGRPVEGLHEADQIGRVVFEVRVLDAHEIVVGGDVEGVLVTGADRGTLASVHGVGQQFDAVAVLLERRRYGSRGLGGSIVDEDHAGRPAVGPCHSFDLRDDLLEGRLLVEEGNDQMKDRHARTLRDISGSRARISVTVVGDQPSVFSSPSATVFRIAVSATTFCIR